MSASATLEQQPSVADTPPRNKLGISPPSAQRQPRPLGRRIMQFVRRSHLYLGLFLFPWAVLYGVTGFLFNHPTYFADAPTTTIRRADVIGTLLEDAPDVQSQAVTVLAALNEKQLQEAEHPSAPLTLGKAAARYATRDSFVATVKADARTFFVTYDPKTSSGVIRETTPKAAAAEPAPFATGKADAPRQRGMGMGGPMKHDHAGIRIEDSITDRIKAAVPTIMERKGFPRGEVTVTTSPDIKFPVDVNGQLWTAIYNPLTTAVTGTVGTETSDLSIRSFLLRMHLSRGYPGAVNTKWVWAVGVDAIALTLCFWGVSGLFMWWQIKATRWPGLIVLILSTVIATALGMGMHGLLSA